MLSLATSMEHREARSADLLREVARLYVRAQRSVADCCATSSTQCLMLIELDRVGPISMGDLGARLSLEKSWVSRAVDTLVDDGLVAKSPNPRDARSWLLSLTAAGRRRCGSLEVQLDGHARKVMSRLAPSERTVVNQGLALILRALREDAGIAGSCPAPKP
jgi:DNA-binding MarR family transcriptional regulator